MADENFDYLNKTRTAELVSEIKRRLGSKADQVFVGTTDEWDALPDEQKASYTILYVLDDTSDGKVIVSETEPESGMDEGDYWIEISSNESAKALYKYVVDPEDDTAFLWDKQCDFVGENIGQHNERFNDYNSNTIGSGDYNHVEGQRNSNYGDHSHVGGYNNVLSGSNTVGYPPNYSVIYGDANRINVGALASSLLIGHGITLQALSSGSPGLAAYSLVTGAGHSITASISQCTVLGNENKIYAATFNSIVSGYNNTITDQPSNSIVAGSGNTITGYAVDSFVGGSGNSVGAAYQSIIWGRSLSLASGTVDQSIICGNENIQTGGIYCSIVAGGHNNVSANNALVAGVKLLQAAI